MKWNLILKNKLFLTGISLMTLTTTLLSCGNNGTKSNESTSKSGSTSTNTDELKAFMLGGIFFEAGYGGKSATESHANAAGTDDDELIESYTTLFVFPFKTEDSADAKTTLKSYWEVSNKEELIKILDDLKNHKLKTSYTKSWDYARLVNNACLGYAAGYLSKEETTNYVEGILPAAKTEYKTWDDYFADFIKGRAKWDTENSSNHKSFEDLAANITKGEHNIYKIVTLN